MNSKQPRTSTCVRSEREPDDTLGTVQLLVSDTGNRTVIEGMLDDHFDVKTSQTIQDADLYLIEDHLFSEYHEMLRERVDQAHPTFCPVVLIRRETTRLAHPTEDAAFHEESILIDDVVDAPIDRSLLIRRLHSLLVRCRQSQELSSHVSILKEREQELRRFERGVEATGNGIVMTNRFGEIDYVNPAIEEITGYTESEVLGETARIFQQAGAADVFTEEFWRTMIDRKEWVGEVVLEHRDETRSVVDTSITAIHDERDDVEGFVIVLNDITERIQQEQELQRREQELDLLRQILTRYLRHNLRNDLSVILGYGEMLSTDETLSDSQAQMARQIVETAQRLQEKSETARQFSTLSQRDTELSSYDLSDLVKECAQTISEQYPEVAFDVDVPDSCEIRARTGIRDAVEELIENAAKHNDAASPHIQIQLRNSNGARLHIEDNGPGISELELGTLEMGEETPLLHSQGVGLWLSKWIIERVDGQLSFDRTDPGTRVTVEFPSPERVGSRGLDIPTLKERDQRLQTVLDRMTNAIVEVNAAWEITFVDARAEEILDLSIEEIQGKMFWEMFSDARNTQFEAVYQDAMESRTSQHVEDYYPGIDGWLSVSVYPEFDGGLSIYFRETTERNQQRQALEQTRSRMELALEVTDAAVWEWDPETDAVTVHPERHPVFEAKIQTTADLIEGVHPDDRSRVQDALETAVETGSPYDVEYRVQTGETVRWATDYGEIHSDEDGNSRMVGVARDITEQKQREQELAQTHELLERTERIAAVGGWEIDTDTMDVFWSDSLYEILGVDRDMEPSLDDALDLYYEDDREIIENAVETALDVGEQFDVEARIRRLDGEIRWLRIQGVPTMDDGEVVTLRGAVQDITELKEREQQLEAERRRFQSLVDVLPHGVYRADPDTLETTYANDAFERIHGYTGSEWRENPDLWGHALHPDDAERVTETFRTHRESRESGQLEYRIQPDDEDTRWIEDTFRWEYDEAGNVTALVGVYTDITNRKEREREREEFIRELEQSEEKLQLALEAGEMGIWELDLQSEESPARTPQHDQIFGYEPPVEDWSFDRFLDHVLPADRERIEESFDEAFETGRLEFECRIVRADGELRWIAAEGEFFADLAGTPDHAIGIVEDITDRKERERALEERVKELTAIQQTVHTFLRSDGALDDSFEAFVEALPQSFQYPGIAAAKITYKEYEASTADFEPREECLTAQQETGSEGIVQIEIVYLEERSSEDDGPFLTEEQELLDTLVTLIGSYVERWEYVQQLERQNKQLEAFTSIVSHDLRNPLTVAQGRLELLQDECQSEHIEHIGDAHHRIGTLIEDMLTLARHGDQVGETEPVVLSEVVESCWQTVDTTDATLVIETEQTIFADESRLRQLLENVLRNSIEHGGAAVTVTVGNLDNGFYIEDDGPGIVPENREAVFETGYTISSDGTGFGLSSVKQIVDGHGWTIRITDGSSCGARFEITNVDFN